MRIQNYGDWKGDKPEGHHPPACTCYRCNEERRRLEASKEEERRVKEYDRRVAETEARSAAEKPRSGPERSPFQGRSSSRDQPRGTRSNQSNRNRGTQSNKPSRTNSQRQAEEAVRQSKVGARPAARTRPTSPSRAPREQQGKVVALSKAVTASALRYALALHAAAVVGLVMYALIQGGTPNVIPTLDGAADAYVNAWR